MNTNAMTGSLEQTNDDLLNEAEQLIWSLLDETLEEADVTRLEGLVQEKEAVRTRYLECVQLHSDLAQHFSEKDVTESFDKPQSTEPQSTEPQSLKPQSPVLGSPGELRPNSDSWPPVAE